MGASRNAGVLVGDQGSSTCAGQLVECRERSDRADGRIEIHAEILCVANGT